MAAAAERMRVRMALVIAEAGFAILPDFYIREEVQQSRLVRVLRDWTLPAGGIYAVFPPTQFRLAATRKFADLFAARLNGCLDENNGQKNRARLAISTQRAACGASVATQHPASTNSQRRVVVVEG